MQRIPLGQWAFLIGCALLGAGCTFGQAENGQRGATATGPCPFKDGQLAQAKREAVQVQFDERGTYRSDGQLAATIQKSLLNLLQAQWPTQCEEIVLTMHKVEIGPTDQLRAMVLGSDNVTIQLFTEGVDPNAEDPDAAYLVHEVSSINPPETVDDVAKLTFKPNLTPGTYYLAVAMKAKWYAMETKENDDGELKYAAPYSLLLWKQKTSNGCATPNLPNQLTMTETTNWGGLVENFNSSYVSYPSFLLQDGNGTYGYVTTEWWRFAERFGDEQPNKDTVCLENVVGDLILCTLQDPTSSTAYVEIRDCNNTLIGTREEVVSQTTATESVYVLKDGSNNPVGYSAKMTKNGQTYFKVTATNLPSLLAPESNEELLASMLRTNNMNADTWSIDVTGNGGTTIDPRLVLTIPASKTLRDNIRQQTQCMNDQANTEVAGSCQTCCTGWGAQSGSVQDVPFDDVDVIYLGSDMNGIPSFYYDYHTDYYPYCICS